MPIIEEKITNLDTAKAIARMAGLGWIAIDGNGQIWGYPNKPKIEADDIWQAGQGDSLMNIIFIAITNEPDLPHREVYEL